MAKRKRATKRTTRGDGASGGQQKPDLSALPPTSCTPETVQPPPNTDAPAVSEATNPPPKPPQPDPAEQEPCKQTATGQDHPTPPVSDSSRPETATGTATTNQAATSQPPGSHTADDQDAGGVTPAATVAAGQGSLVESHARETLAQACNRWTREGRRQEADEFRENARLSGLRAGLSRFDANQRAWGETLRAFPPPGFPVTDLPPLVEPEPEAPEPVDPPPAEPAPAGVSGLGEIPDDWPSLPSNASLAAEIQWVQSSRIDVVEELPGGAVRVDLSRADRPAPSKAAIGWLETSIRAYSKYCDIAAKATSAQEDEREHVRREKLAIDEVRGLLAEMLPGPPCPTCGQDTPPGWDG